MSRQALRGRTKINTWCQTNRPWSTRGGTSPEAKKGLLQAFARSSIDKFMIFCSLLVWVPTFTITNISGTSPPRINNEYSSPWRPGLLQVGRCTRLVRIYGRKVPIIERRNQSQPRLALPSILVCARTDETQQRHAKSASQNPEKWAIGGVVVSVQNFQDGTKAVGKNRRQHQHVELYKFGDNLLLWMGKIQIPVFSFCALGKSQIRCRLAYMTLLILS